jgi:uncharacterized membrane protein
MRNNHNTQVFDAHYSSATKYYNILLILVIAIPLCIGCFVSLKGPLAFTISMFACLPIIALLVYLTISSGNLRYEISDNELKIKILFYTKKIPYTQITNAEKVQLGLMLKLFGAGMPGLYWGMFSTSIGNAQVYGTKRMGDYIALTLTTGQKIVISPKDPQQFLNTLSQQKPNLKTTAIYQTDGKQKQTSPKLVYTQVLMVTAVYCIFLGYFFIVYTALPQIIPMQFDFSGVVTRFADKTELLWIAGIPIIFPIINAIIALKFGKYSRNLLILLGVTFITIIAEFVPILYAIASLA